MLPKSNIKIIEPKLPSYLEKQTFKNCLYEEELEGYYFEEDKVKTKKTRLDVRDSFLRKIDFTSFEGVKSSFVNIIFENCDLSNANFEESTIHRITFKDCKLVGTNFLSSSIMDVSFLSCFMNYSNFNDSKMKNVKCKDCKIEEASFRNMKMKNIELDACSFQKTEFLHTSLKDIDFSTSNIAGIKVGMQDIIGMQVNVTGALALTPLLQIEIKEEV